MCLFRVLLLLLALLSTLVDSSVVRVKKRGIPIGLFDESSNPIESIDQTIKQTVDQSVDRAESTTTNDQATNHQQRSHHISVDDIIETPKRSNVDPNDNLPVEQSHNQSGNQSNNQTVDQSDDPTDDLFYGDFPAFGGHPEDVIENESVPSSSTGESQPAVPTATSTGVQLIESDSSVHSTNRSTNGSGTPSTSQSALVQQTTGQSSAPAQSEKSSTVLAMTATGSLEMSSNDVSYSTASIHRTEELTVIQASHDATGPDFDVNAVVVGSIVGFVAVGAVVWIIACFWTRRSKPTAVTFAANTHYDADQMFIALPMPAEKSFNTIIQSSSQPATVDQSND